MSSSALTVREPFNAISHVVGAVLIAAGATWLALAHWGNPSAVVAFAIFGVTSTLLYAASAAYHWADERFGWLRRMDHAAIYVMIAGTYTPVAFLALEPAARNVVLLAQWGLATIGVVASLRMAKVPTAVRLTLYLVMGWMALPLLPGLSGQITPTGLWLMLGGGLAYTFGTVIYASGRPRLWPGRFGAHELWHLFVMGGSACHFAMMWHLL